MAITPENISVTSSDSENELSLTEDATGVYSGTYSLTQADIDERSVTIFADVTYLGDNDTVILQTSLEEEVEEGDEWLVNIDYKSASDRTAGFGDTINLKITVTKNGVKTDPDNISATVSSERSTRATTRDIYNSGIPLETKKIAAGEYELSYALPTEGNESKDFEFSIDILSNGISEWEYFSHQIDIYKVWYHQLSLTNKSAEYDIYVTDVNNNIIPSADIEITLEYYAQDYVEKKDTQKKQTDTSGKANFKFNYQDIDDNSFDLDGKVTANSKTQYFQTYITHTTYMPTPYGSQLEIMPVIDDDTYFSYLYATPDTNGNIKKEYNVYSNLKLLKNTDIYYYIISGMYSSYIYDLENLDEIKMVKTGVATTDDNGSFSVEFKSGGTRNNIDYGYYYIYIEAAIGTFEEVMEYYRSSSRDVRLVSQGTSRDGLFYAEDSSYFIVSDIPYLFTFEDIISSNVKITIPKLNQGSPTDIEVRYTGLFVEPESMVMFYPGTITPEDSYIDFETDWGQWCGPEGDYLTKSNGIYTGQITVPSFMPGDTFSILGVFQNTQYTSDLESIYSYSDYIQINIVTLKVGESIKDGGYDSKPEKPSDEEIDSDSDGFSDGGAYWN